MLNLFFAIVQNSANRFRPPILYPITGLCCVSFLGCVAIENITEIDINVDSSFRPLCVRKIEKKSIPYTITEKYFHCVVSCVVIKKYLKSKVNLCMYRRF